jgi:hypothetical protein
MFNNYIEQLVIVPKPTNTHKYMKVYYTHTCFSHCSSCAVCVIHFHTLRCAFFSFDVMSKALCKGIRLKVLIGTKMLIVMYDV